MTERLARISARRPWATIGVWLLLMLVMGGIGQNLLPTALTTELRFMSTFTQVEAQQADDLLRDSQLDPLSEAVLVQSETLTVEDPAFRSKVAELTGALIALGPEVVTGGANYYLTNDERLVSADRRTTVILAQLKGPIAHATENAEELIHLVDEANRDGFRVLVAGNATIAFENGELSEADLVQGERIGIPIALLILLVLFGAVVAALIPIGLALISIVITMAIVALIGNIFGELVFFVQLWVTMIGLAVGIDYSLFVVSRFREELAKGGEQPGSRRANGGHGEPHGALQRGNGGYRAHGRIYRPTRAVFLDGPRRDRGGYRFGHSHAHAAACRSGAARTQD